MNKQRWALSTWGNSDKPRMVHAGAYDAPAFREASSKLLTTFLL